MSKMLNRLKRVLWFVALPLALILIGLTYSSTVRFDPFELKNVAFAGTRTVTFPWLEQGIGPADYEIRGSFEVSWMGPRSLRIIPDDRVTAVTVNDHPIDLSGYQFSQLQDVKRGFVVDLSDIVQTGKNTIVIQFHDYGGEVGMKIERGMTDLRSMVLVLGWGLLLLISLLAGLNFGGTSAKHGFFYLLIAVGTIIKIWYIYTYNPVDHIFSDPARHWEQGIDVLRMDLMSLTDPIGYQLYIAALAKFTLKIPGLVAYCTCLLAIVGPWLWYRFFRELQSSKTMALAGWAFLSLLPSWTAIYAYFMQETLMLPLMGGALWMSWRCRRKADLRSFLWMVFLWVAAGLTRGIAIPIAAVCCTWLWLAQEQKWPKAIYSSIILVLIMGPLTYRSYQTVNHFAPHGMGELNIVYARSGKKVIEIQSRLGGSGWGHGFGSPSTGAEPFKPFSDWKTQRTGTVRINIDLGKGSEDWDKAIAATNMTFSDYLWITKEGLIFLFFAESWPDNNLARTVDVVNSVMRWIWAPLFVVLVIGVAIHHRKFKGQWMLPAMILAWFIVQGLVPIAISEGRYRKPFEGLAVAELLLWIGVIRAMAREAAPTDPFWHTLKLRINAFRKPVAAIEKVSDDVTEEKSVGVTEENT